MFYDPRFSAPGTLSYFEVALAKPDSDLLIAHIDVLRMAFRTCMAQWPTEIVDAVVLPGRINTVLRTPDGDVDHAKRWRLIKSVFSRHVPAPLGAVPCRKGDKGIWQRGFTGHPIPDQQTYRRYRAEILTAPVQAGLVEHPHDWPHSSIHRVDASVVPIAMGVASA